MALRCCCGDIAIRLIAPDRDLKLGHHRPDRRPLFLHLIWSCGGSAMSALELQEFAFPAHWIASACALRRRICRAIGPNGAGKTTLLRAALGLQAHRGDPRWPPCRPGRAPSGQRFCRNSARSHGRLRCGSGGAGRLPHGDQSSEIIDAVIARLDLAALADRPATRYRRRASPLLLARALVQQAELLLADEPTANSIPPRNCWRWMCWRMRPRRYSSHLRLA
ncbi:ATP-binding cassette domain-containing protein [Ketogulonicigenium vulgare]|uniref:ATP-binding cassette domain-containing protein n=1 Tax=Ketogulonicigenium vulgare TaxID=92945 RepID=UPI0020C79B94|nr:hypothetical protein [Ketogulonicigenium vulgare]